VLPKFYQAKTIVKQKHLPKRQVLKMPKKQPHKRSNIATQEKKAASTKNDYEEFLAKREKRNSSQKDFKERNKKIKVAADKAGVARLPDIVAKEAKKKSNQTAQEKRMAHSGKLRIVEVDNVGMKGSLLVDPVPHYMMLQMLVHCFSSEFQSQYDTRKTKIDLPKGNSQNHRVDACGDKVDSSKGASYYMLNWNNSKPLIRPSLTENRWENNTTMSVSGITVIDSLGKLLSTALKAQVGGEKDFQFAPGFVSTRGAAHQELHVDSPVAYQAKEGNGGYILHMPLTTEGLTLRIANLDDGIQAQMNGPLTGEEIKGDLPADIMIHDFFYHVPFGKALLLPERQWHAGFYGKSNNLRFHAVFFRGEFEAASLMLLEQSLRTNYPTANIRGDLDLHEIKSDDVLGESITAQSTQHTTHYV
jgi:hypothetical protein